MYGTKYSRMDQVKFVEDSLYKISKDIVCFKQTIPFQISQRLSSTNFTWFILEYFVSYKPICHKDSYLCGCNGIRTHNHLIRKRTLNHLAKLARNLSFGKKLGQFWPFGPIWANLGQTWPSLAIWPNLSFGKKKKLKISEISC